MFYETGHQNRAATLTGGDSCLHFVLDSSLHDIISKVYTLQLMGQTQATGFDDFFQSLKKHENYS